MFQGCGDRDCLVCYGEEKIKSYIELEAENKRLRDALENLASIKWLCNCSHAIDGRKHSELCALGIIHKALKETE